MIADSITWLSREEPVKLRGCELRFSFSRFANCSVSNMASVILVCVECEETVAFCHCKACGDLFCSACWQRIHFKGPKQAHPWEPCVQPAGVIQDMPVPRALGFPETTVLPEPAAVPNPGSKADIVDDGTGQPRRGAGLGPGRRSSLTTTWSPAGQPSGARGGEDGPVLADVGSYVRRRSVVGQLGPSLSGQTHLKSDEEVRAEVAAQMGVRAEELQSLEQTRDHYVLGRVAEEGVKTEGFSKREVRRASVVLSGAGMLPGGAAAGHPVSGAKR